MAWERPTLATLIKRNQADIEAEIQGVDAKVRRKNLNIIAKMVSLVAHTLYGYIAGRAKQIHPATSDTENLDRHASFWLKDGRRGATFASGPVDFNGSIGSEIEENTVMLRSDGIEYLVVDGGIFAGTTLTLTVEALQAGQAGNAEPGTTLSLSQPIDGVTSSAVVSGDGLTGGVDVESNDSVNQRIEDRVQNPPHGGATHDYETWAKEIAGVTRVWVAPKELGAGKVTVRFVRDNDTDIIPTESEVEAVQAHLDKVTPTTAKAYAVAPIAEPLDFDIRLTPDTPATRAAVQAELDDLIRRESEPGGTLLISHIREAISLAAGETDHQLLSPVADVVKTTGKMATLGDFTWA